MVTSGKATAQGSEWRRGAATWTARHRMAAILPTGGCGGQLLRRQSGNSMLRLLSACCRRRIRAVTLSFVASESERLHDVWRRPALPVRASRHRGRVIAGESERLRDVWQRPALRVRVYHRRGRVLWLRDWHCRCAPPIVVGESERLRNVWRRPALPIVAGESEQLRDVWQRPALPVRASHRRGRVRKAS